MSEIADPVEVDLSLRWGVSIPLPGVNGRNERVIELPLAVEAMRLGEPGWVLDAGCSLNQVYAGQPTARLVHVTLNLKAERELVRSHWRSFVAADLRDLSLFSDAAFRSTVCVSTLEHIGLDNRHYGAPEEESPDSVWLAVTELLRVTRDNLLITVPFHHEPLQHPQWRYWTEVDLVRLWKFARNRGWRMDVTEYAEHEGHWQNTIVGAKTDGLDRVQRIAAVRLVRAA